MRDFYRILGIPDNATMGDIKSAYRRLAKQYHPDLNPGSRQSEEKFKEILDAYTILSDEELRAQYDRKRRIGSTTERFSSRFDQQNGPEKKKDPGRKEHPPEYIEMMRQRNRARVVKQINRRKKLLRGMIITFVLYLVATAAFESWLDDRRKGLAGDSAGPLKRDKNDNTEQTDVIHNLDSPYDSLFGPAQSTWLSPNQLVVINPFSDAVVCLVRADSPHVTIRNEFIHSRQSFIMKEIPNGRYFVKVYTGKTWSTDLKVPDGQVLGGFASAGKYFIIERDPIVLIKPTYNNRNTITSDTVRIDTAGANIREISRDDFFVK